MKSSHDTVLQLPAALGSDRLLARLASRGTLEAGDCRSASTEFFDSLDGDLWFAGLTLYKSDGELRVARLDDLLLTSPVAECQWSGAVPHFAWEFPESALSDRLAGTLKLRALQPLLQADVETRLVEVKNIDRKTVVRFQLKTVTSPRDGHQTKLELCCVQPLRGYDADARDLIDDLLELGLYRAGATAVARFVGELANVPDVHPAKHAVMIDRTYSSREAVCRLVREFWRFARSRENGIVDDIDTEFLHEYRVALRRIRALIAQAKDVFPTDISLQLKTQFGQLARATNRLRDLDVYLLAETQYRNMLPDCLRTGLDQLFTDFAVGRGQEQDQLSRRLASADYQTSAMEIDHLLDRAETSPASEAARRPVTQMAMKIIRKRYEKIVRQGTAIDHATPDDSIHQLRIDCKKLRYSLEFFGPLFDRSEIAATIKRLKKLQDSLGIFNDLCVQQAALSYYLNEKKNCGGASAVLSASIGGLIGALHQRQIEQRNRSENQIARFCSPDVAAMFAAIRQPSRRAA